MAKPNDPSLLGGFTSDHVPSLLGGLFSFTSSESHLHLLEWDEQESYRQPCVQVTRWELIQEGRVSKV